MFVAAVHVFVRPEAIDDFMQLSEGAQVLFV